MSRLNALKNVIPGIDHKTDEEQADEPRTDGAPATSNNREHPKKLNTGVFIGPNSLADAIQDNIDAVEHRFGIRFPITALPDTPLERNPLKIEDVAPLAQPEIEEALLKLSHDVDYALVPMSLGTAYPLYKLSDVRFAFENTIDVVVSSHKTKPAKLESAAQNTILAGVGVALMDSPAILINHRAREANGKKEVPPELAQVLMAIAHTDVANRNFGYWAVGHEVISIGGRTEMDLSPAVQRAAGELVANDLSGWCSVERWAPWEPDTSVQFMGDPDKFAIVPHGMDIGQGQHDITMIRADVSNCHVCVFRPLDREWVHESVREAGLNYVDARIHDENSMLNQVWAAHCNTFGKSDPVAEWERFVDERIQPELPDSITLERSAAER